MSGPKETWDKNHPVPVTSASPPHSTPTQNLSNPGPGLPLPKPDLYIAQPFWLYSPLVPCAVLVLLALSLVSLPPSLTAQTILLAMFSLDSSRCHGALCVLRFVIDKHQHAPPPSPFTSLLKSLLYFCAAVHVVWFGSVFVR